MENIIEFKKPAETETGQEIADNVLNGAPINLPCGATLEVTAEGLGFADLGAAINMRDWLERACEAAGAIRKGGGIGCGQADIDIELEGCGFNVSIRPI